MESPIDKFVDWYLSLPKSHQMDIGAIVGSCCPGFDFDISDIDKISFRFIDGVKRSLVNRQLEVGMTLLLKSAIEFYFISRRSNESDWVETKLKLEALAKKTNSEKFANSARETEFRAKQWVATCKKWYEVREYFTDDYLRNYEIGN